MESVNRSLSSFAGDKMPLSQESTRGVEISAIKFNGYQCDHILRLRPIALGDQLPMKTDKRALRIAAIFISLLILVPSARAESLGSGYACSGKKLTYKSNSITIASAKSALGDVIKDTKALLKKASSGSAKAIKLQAKIDALTALLAKVKSCAAGKYVPAIFSTLSKAYTTGAWNNTTFSTTGGISALMSLSGTLFSVSINIGGDMFGSLHPAPIEFQKNVGGVTFPFSFTVQDTTIGDLKITFKSNGNFTVEETVVPGLPNILRATLDASFEDGRFSGSFHSFLIGDVQLAQGTMSLQ